MILTLTSEQAEAVRSLLKPGTAVLGRVQFHPYAGDVSRCGEIEIEVGTVPEASLPALREAIRTANTDGKPKARRRKASK